MQERESPNAMPAPWLSAWGARRGWPAKVPEARVGPLMPMWPILRAGAHGSANARLGSPDTLALYHPNVPVFYRQSSGPGAPPVLRTDTYHPVYGFHPTAVPTGFAPPSRVTGRALARSSGRGALGALGDDWGSDPSFDPGSDGGGDSGPLLGADPSGGADSWPVTWPDQGGDSGPLTAADPTTGEDITTPADFFDSGPLLGADPNAVLSEAESTASGAVSAAGTALKGILGIAPALLKAFFPAGLPALWTPCPKGMYYVGGQCHVSPLACPEGTVYTGSTCAPASFLCNTLGLGCSSDGGGDGGGLFFAQEPVTSSWWFWPVVIGGGGLIVLVAVRRR
jgi:hypothetical protein